MIRQLFERRGEEKTSTVIKEAKTEVKKVKEAAETGVEVAKHQLSDGFSFEQVDSNIRAL
jgi:hypothetical protein